MAKPYGLEPVNAAYELEPKGFMAVYDGGGQFPVSPAKPVDPQWRGAMLTAPQKVFVRAQKHDTALALLSRIPVCLYYCFQSGSPEMDFVHKAKIIMYNAALKKEYCGEERQLFDGNMLTPYAEADGEPIPVGFYKNFNLLSYVDIPLESAAYLVRIVVGNAESNDRQVEIIVEK